MYTITSVGVDAVGNVQSPAASKTFTYDAAVPTSAVTAPAAAFAGPTTWAASNQLGGTTSDSGAAGVAGVSVNITRSSDGNFWNGTSWQPAAIGLVASVSAGSWLLSLPASALADGLTYTIASTATDTVGNVQATPGTRAFTWDSVAPTQAITAPPTGSVQGTATLTGFAGTAADPGAAASGVTAVSLTLTRVSDGFGWNGAAFVSGTTQLPAVVAGANWTYSFSPANLADGQSYTLTATAGDAVLNVGSAASSTFAFDTSGPTNTIATPAAGTVTATTWAGLAGSASDSGAGVQFVEYRVLTAGGLVWNGTAFAATGNWFTASGTTTWAAPFAFANFPADGGYRVEARGVDALGNVGAVAAVDFTVTLPTVTGIAFQTPAASPTNTTAPVTWRVSFSDPVAGVTDANVTLVGSFGGSAAITGVAPVGGSSPATAWDVTASIPAAGTGTLGLNFTSALGLSPAVSTATSVGPVYTLDRIAPTAAVTNTAAATTVRVNAAVHYTVTFADDTAVASAVLTPGDVANAVTSGGAAFTVTNFTSVGLRGYEFDVTPTSAGDFQLLLTAPAVSDTAGNPLAVPVTDATVLTVDATAPSVVSVVRAGTTPSNAAQVNYTVTFSEDVTGIDAADFSVSVLSGSIVPGAVSVNAGSGTVFTVTVLTGSGDGMIRLDVVNDGSILDVPGNPLAAGFTTGDVYTIDKTAPTATVVLDAGQVTPTSVQPVGFLVTFLEPVTSFGAGGVSLSGSAGGLATASILVTNPNGDNQTFRVAVSGLTTDGTFALTVTSGAATDHAGNLFTDVVTSPTVTLDTLAPVVSSITRDSGSPTNLGSVSYTVVFNESVSGVDAADFVLDAIGLSGTTIGVVTGGGTTWTVPVNTGSGDGSLRLDLRTTAILSDAAGNPIGTAGFPGETYDLIRSSPTAVFTDPVPALRNTPVTSVVVTFNRVVTGLDVGDFTLTRDGTPVDLSAATLTGGPTTFTLGNLAGLTGTDGVYVLTLTAATAGVTDTIGNPFVTSVSTGFTIDVTASTVVLTRGTAGPTNAAAVTFTVTFDDVVLGVDTNPAGGFDHFGLTGTAPGVAITSISPAGAGVYTVVVNAGSGDGTIVLTLDANGDITDAAGNPVSNLPAASLATTVDHTRPTVSVVDTDADGLVAVNQEVVFLVDVLDAGGVTGSPAAGDFSNLGSAGFTIGTITSAAIGGGVRFSVPVTATTGGSLLIQLNAGAGLADPAGNAPLLPVQAGRTLTVDASTPTVAVSLVSGQAALTNAQPVRFAVLFSEAVVGFDNTKVTLAGPGVGGATISVSGGGLDYVVSVTGLGSDGPVTLTIAAGAVTDVAGNPSAASAATATVTLDTAAPAVGTPVLDPASDTGAADGITADTTPQITGTAEAGATVELFEGSIFRGSATASGGGTWSITTPVLGDGAHTLFARATDAAGNVTNSATLTVTIDTGAPTVAVTRGAGQDATVLGTAAGTSVTIAVTFSEPVGGLDPSLVSVVGTAGGAITSVVPSGGSGGVFLVTVGGIVRPGTVSVTVGAGAGIDAAGNPSSAAPAGESVLVQFTTNTAVTVAPSVIRAGDALTVTAVVTSPAGMAGGDVTFTVAGAAANLTRTVPFTGASVAATFAGLTAGSYTVTVAFAGSGGFLDSSAAAAFTIIPDQPVGQNNTDVYAAVTGTTVTMYDADGMAKGTAAPFSRAESPFGVRVAVADVTGDGVPDLIGGTAPGVPAAVRVLDGATGATLFSMSVFDGFTGGVYVAAGDLNGDGRSEIVVSPDQFGGPRVLVIDGATGTQLASFLGITDQNFRGGARVAVGDVNGDGVADIVVAAGFGGGPRVAGFDGTSIGAGKTPAKLFADFFIFEESLRNGAYVTVGDVDNDGFGDIIGGGGPGGAPRVIALSGHDLVTTGAFTPVANFFAGPADLRGGVRVTAKDFDGDGRADLVVGSGDTGKVFVFTNADLLTSSPTPDDGFDVIAGLLAGVHVG